MCDSQKRSVFYLQAYQGSMSKYTVPVCFTDLCSQIGLVLQTVAILGWRAPTFSYQFSSQCFIICQLIYAGIICNALVFMLDKVKIMQEAVQCNIKRMWIKKINSFFFYVIWCCPLIYSFTTQYLKSSCHK